MASRINVTDLDFDQIKLNLINFLKQQDEFQDYNFEGSSLNVLIDLLAYNTHYNAYYLNMIANESFLDTALLRDSVVSHAKVLNYIPTSKSASKAIINIEIETNDSTIETLTIPRGTSFSSELIDNFPYNFVMIKDETVTKSNTKYIFENIEIYEGTLNSITFIQDNNSNPNQIFVLPDIDIDTRTLKVTVTDATTSNTEIYTLSTDVLDLNSASKAYFLQEGKNGFFEIYFGDDYISKKLSDGSSITADYLITNGIVANKSQNFVPNSTIIDENNNTINNNDITVTLVDAASGGSDRESVDSIKFSATKKYSTQNRLVTAKDYAAYLQTNYPGIQSISVWGGEEQVPVVYNKTYISLKMKDGFYLTLAEKDRIVDEIIKPKAIISTEAEIIDPDYIYLLIEGTIKYDKEKTNLTKTDLLQKVRNSIISYNDTYLETFNSRYVQSRLQETIDKSDTSFIGSTIRTRIQKRIIPTLNLSEKFQIEFGTKLHRGSLNDGLISSFFYYVDFQGFKRLARIEEIPYSFTGIDSISITNTGSNYKSAPKITISGDGEGATAKAKIKNGQIIDITVTNPGINYTRASVIIEGDGISGAATANIQGKMGKLRLVYYNTNSEVVLLQKDAGTIYYDQGYIVINDLKINSLPTNDLRFLAYAEDTIVDSTRNSIVLIDSTDGQSIKIEIESV